MKNNFFKTLKVVIVLVAVCSMLIGCGNSKYCEISAPNGFYWCEGGLTEEECRRRGGLYLWANWAMVDSCREDTKKYEDDLENDYDIDIEYETEKVEPEE